MQFTKHSLNPTISFKRQDNRQKAFPAKNFIQINSTFALGSKNLSIFLRTCIQACNFCTHFNCVDGDSLIGAFANKITKIIQIWGKQSFKQFLKTNQHSKTTFTVL